MHGAKKRAILTHQYLLLRRLYATNTQTLKNECGASVLKAILIVTLLALCTTVSAQKSSNGKQKEPAKPAATKPNPEKPTQSKPTTSKPTLTKPTTSKPTNKPLETPPRKPVKPQDENRFILTNPKPTGTGNTQASAEATANTQVPAEPEPAAPAPVPINPQKTQELLQLLNNAFADVNQVKELIASGADVNARDRDGETPLIKAAWMNKSLWVNTALIEAGADVNAVGAASFHSYTPLTAAIRYNNIEVMTAIMNAGADLNICNNFGSPIINAVMDNGNDPGKLAMLINAGADVNARDSVERTPLIAAAYYGNTSPDIYTMLIEAGADINAVDYFGRTALSYAIEKNLIVIQEILLQAGAR